jgi:hypothetical protein
MIRGFIRWFFRLLYGTIILCWVLQFHPKIQQYFRNTLLSLAEKEWSSQISCGSCHINCLTGSVYLDEVTVTDVTRPATWWKFKTGRITTSFFDLLTTSSLGIYIDIYDASGHSTTNAQGLTLKQHFEQITTATSNLPIQIQRVTLENFSATLTHATKTYKAQTKTSLVCSFDPRAHLWVGNVFSCKGELFCDDYIWAHDVSFTGAWIFESDTDLYTWQGSYEGKIAPLPSTYQPVQGTLNGSAQQILGTTALNDLARASWIFADNNVSGTILSAVDLPGGLLTTTAHGFFDGKTQTGRLKGRSALESHATATFDLNVADNIAQGFFDLQHQGFHATKTAWHGTVFYDSVKDCGNFIYKNLSSFQWPERAARSKPHMIVGSGIFDCSLSLTTTTKLRWLNRIFDQTHEALCTLQRDNNAIQLSLKNEKHLLNLHGMFNTPLLSASGTYLYGKQPVAELTTNTGKPAGTIIGNLATLNRLNEQTSFLPGLQLQGVLTCSFEQTVNNQFTFSWHTSDGFVRMQDCSITITAAHGTGSYNQLTRQLASTDVTLNTLHGEITAPYITGIFDQLYKPIFAHGSLLLHNLHVQWQQEMRGELDALVCGHYTYPNLPRLDGQIFIKNGVIKQCSALEEKPEERLCGAYLPGSTQQNGIELNLIIQTENPLTFATAALSAQTTALLNLTTRYTNGHFHKPQLTGNIHCKQGIISLFKHKLTMTRGQAEFLPHRPYDPQVECIAHTRIKQYLVSLYISGAASKPHISFSSVPHLSQEQILAMLIAGSDTAQMHHDLPTIILQNLHGIFVGEQKNLRTTSLLKALTKPLEYIQITPQFSNQTGRGGVKATISIDVNPQLHAHMQKDFSLQEDLAIDVEYFLSDDINIRVAKDSRGDVGAEAEVRCKFS